MRDYSPQKSEIETIKPRTITVNLSDADVKRLAEKSGEGGLTISELLLGQIFGAKTPERILCF